jgi:bifunctional enzyme CysN/CysC
MDHDALVPGAFYFIRLGAHVVSATITNLQYEIDANTRDHPAETTFDLTEIGFCRPRCLQLTSPAK